MQFIPTSKLHNNFAFLNTLLKNLTVNFFLNFLFILQNEACHSTDSSIPQAWWFDFIPGLWKVRFGSAEIQEGTLLSRQFLRSWGRHKSILFYSRYSIIFITRWYLRKLFVRINETIPVVNSAVKSNKKLK